MADPLIKALDKISKPGTPVATFLKKLGPIHTKWHTAHNSGTGKSGFLLFHWELIKRFKAVGGPAHFGGVTPFTTADFVSFSAPYDVNVTVTKKNLVRLEEFSSDVELWHNNAHMAVGMAFHKNLMNPKTNVRLVQFWKLHYFINDRFEEKLADFEPGASIPAVVVHVEAGKSATVV